LLSLSLVQSLSAFMAAMPPGQSPLRISIAIRAGANTMLANLWLLLALVPLILWAPQLFQALPVVHIQFPHSITSSHFPL
jgi:MFS superfamily sulfate permease-like transporter